jgi:hypothetical protein
MNANPRFTHLLALYAQFDRLTLILAGVALTAVLIGFLLARSGSGKFERVVGYAYNGFLIISFILILAGTFFLLTGGSS